MPLIVDSREKIDIRKWLYLKGVRYKVKALKTGDYLFYDEDEKNRVLVERKTVSDLVCSYRDGRLKSQFLRMSEEQYPVLLVTGSLKDVEKYVKVDKHIIQHVMSDAMVKYGFRGMIWVVNSNCDAHQEGLVFLSEMFKNLQLGNLDRSEVVKKRRKVKATKTVVGKKKKRGESVKEIDGVSVVNKIQCKRCGDNMILSDFGKKPKWICRNFGCE